MQRNSMKFYLPNKHCKLTRWSNKVRSSKRANKHPKSCTNIVLTIRPFLYAHFGHYSHSGNEWISAQIPALKEIHRNWYLNRSSSLKNLRNLLSSCTLYGDSIDCKPQRPLAETTQSTHGCWCSNPDRSFLQKMVLSTTQVRHTPAATTKS